MSKSRHLLTAAIALVLGAGACTDTSVEPEEQLTEQEAMDLLDGYRVLFLDEEPTVISETAGGAVIECPLGGQAEFQGGGEEEFVGDTARLNVNININPMACRVSANGNEFTITGDPGVREEISVEIVAIDGFFESFDVTGTTVGTLAWESGDRSGTCDIDLVLSAEPDLDPENPGVTGTLSGMLCGHEVDIDVAELPIE